MEPPSSDPRSNSVTLGGARLRPGYVLPRAFALFGGVSGLFAILAAGAFREAARDVSPLVPAMATALVGALAGYTLGRLGSEKAEALSMEVMVVRVGAVSVLAGALSGGIVGGITWGSEGILRFALGGALVGTLFYPGCHAVFRASVRASRARHGSLVAAADLRTVLSTLLAGASLVAATQVPALLKVAPSVHLHPLVQASISALVCLAAMGAILALRRRDDRDRAALDAATAGSDWLERVDEPQNIAHDAVDLGLGEEHYAAGGSQGYREAASAVKLRGSVEDARNAFRECQRSRHVALVFATGALVQVVGAILLRVTEMK